jgi:hypothetical protein
MPSRDNYRTKAKACVEATQAMRDPTERLAMLQVAESYMKLANRAAASHERGTPRRAQNDLRPEKPELERFCSTLRSVLAGPDDRES